MKATGIVRKIDDLGRIVIPKEIRRTLRIKEGDPLEIYTNRDGSVVFKKYSPIKEISPFANQYSEVLNNETSLPILICDKDSVIAVSGVSEREYIDRRITGELEELIENKKNFILNQDETSDFQAVEGAKSNVKILMPIFANNGDSVGCIVAISNQDFEPPNETQVKLVRLMSKVLSKQIQD